MQIQTFTRFKFIGLCAAAILLVGIEAAQASSPSIQLVGVSSGKGATANIKTYDGKTYVSGVVYRRANWSRPHVHIALIDVKGRAFASTTTSLSGWQGKASHGQRGTYTASFESSEIARASVVQITVLSGLHTHCVDSPKATES